MSYVTKSWVETQFQNFATRIGLMFAKKTEIPAKVSDLTNDAGFVTASVNNLTNYYTKPEVNALAVGGGTNALVFDTKEALDTWMEDANNVNNLKVGQNIYIKEEDTPDYWWDGIELQVLETEKVDLDGYVTTDQLNTALNGYIKATDVETENINFSTYFTGSGEA